MNIPANHQAIMPYLMLDDPDLFIAFLTAVFNASFIEKTMTENGKLMHCEASISGSTIMFAGSNNDWPAATANLFIYVDDADITYHKALAAGAESIMGLSNQSYGRTCGVKDPCGNVWWITTVQ